MLEMTQLTERFISKHQRLHSNHGNLIFMFKRQNYYPSDAVAHSAAMARVTWCYMGDEIEHEVETEGMMMEANLGDEILDDCHGSVELVEDEENGSFKVRLV